MWHWRVLWHWRDKTSNPVALETFAVKFIILFNHLINHWSLDKVRLIYHCDYPYCKPYPHSSPFFLRIYLNLYKSLFSFLYSVFTISVTLLYLNFQNSLYLQFSYIYICYYIRQECFSHYLFLYFHLKENILKLSLNSWKYL